MGGLRGLSGFLGIVEVRIGDKIGSILSNTLLRMKRIFQGRTTGNSSAPGRYTEKCEGPFKHANKVTTREATHTVQAPE